MNKRVTVTLPKDQYIILEKQSKKKCIALPTYCRILLCGFTACPEKEESNV